VAAFAGCLALPAARAQSSTVIDKGLRRSGRQIRRLKPGKRAEALVKSGVTFDDALRRLKQGRSYKPQKSGVIHLSNKTSMAST